MNQSSWPGFVTGSMLVYCTVYDMCVCGGPTSIFFQGAPNPLATALQSTTTLYAQGSNILSEIEETFLLKILNAFHSRQRFSCVKNFLWLSTKLRQSYPLPPTWFLLQVPFSNCSTRSHCTNVQISCNETH